MAYSFRKMFVIGQNLKHVYMTYSFLELLILFWLTLDIWCLNFQKQPSREALVQRCSKDALKNFAKSKGKHLCQSPFFNKVADLRLATVLKNSVDFAKFLRTTFFTEHLQWLLLKIIFSSHKRNIIYEYKLHGKPTMK